MGRFALAAIAGFFGACTLLLTVYVFTRSDDRTVPSLSDADSGADEAQRGEIEDLVSAAKLPWRDTDPRMNDEFSSDARTEPEQNVFRLAAATTMLPAATVTNVAVSWPGAVPAASSVSYTDTVPAAFYVQPAKTLTLTLTSTGTPAPQLTKEMAPAPLPPDGGNPLQYSNLGPGKYTITPGLGAEGASASKFEIRSLKQVGSSFIYQPPTSEISGTITPAIGPQTSLNPADATATYKSDGPSVTLAVTDPPGVTDTDVKLFRESSTTPLPALTIEQVGSYTIRVRGTVTGAVQAGGLPVHYQSEKKIVISTVSGGSAFKPTITTIQQSLQGANIASATLSTTPEKLNFQSFFLASPALTVSASSPLSTRKLIVVSDDKLFPGLNATPTDAPTADTAVPISLTDLLPGVHKLNVVDLWAGPSNDAAKSLQFSVVVPQGNTQAPQMAFSQIGGANQKTISTANGLIRTPGNQLALIGVAKPGADVELQVLPNPATTTFSLSTQPTVNVKADKTTGRFEATVTTNPAEGNYGIVALTGNNDDRAYSGVVQLKTAINPVVAAQLQVEKIEYTLAGAGDNPQTAKGADNTIATTDAKITVALNGAEAVDAMLTATLKDKQIGRTILKPASEGNPPAATQTIDVSDLKPGPNPIEIVLESGFAKTPKLLVNINVVNQGPTVTDVQPNPLGFERGQLQLVISFDPNAPLESVPAEDEKNYALIGNSGKGDAVDIQTAVFNPATNEVTLNFTPAPAADYYQLNINGHNKTSINKSVFTKATDATVGLSDIYGNLLSGSGSGNGTDYSKVLDGGSGGAFAAGSPFQIRSQTPLPLVTAQPPEAVTFPVGLPESTGPPVNYREYTDPHPFQDGFNPSDKVITRVARLYYYRDAARVVQIINRRAKSYNAQNATMARQLADQARLFAEQTTDRSRAAERQAVSSASSARQAENALVEYQQQVQTAQNDVSRGTQQKLALESQINLLKAAGAVPAAIPGGQDTSVELTQDQRLGAMELQLKQLDDQLTSAQNNLAQNQARVKATVAATEALREQELQSREVMDQERAKDDRAIAQQFRLEVQAATEDPDTYAPGNPDSKDPVAQVSLSVIGEGLIQMRGPRKGINIILTMINQIDSPVGQVRIGIHTVQVNGERGEKMEEVVGRIGRYIDQSRFLTTQSTQMLRNAIVLVASRRAQEAGYLCEGGIQTVDGQAGFASGIMPPEAAGSEAERYQYAFFGHEFIDQLRQMDSEFLKDGNKLLSLNSMDTTSLASALFVLALANNDTRLEILETFRQMVMCQLPASEVEYFDASDMSRGIGCRKFKFLGNNARFVSLRGYFDSHVDGAQTLNPAQREFIKLAQILKSRLVTEIELKQRVLERALIEERLGNYQQQLKFARERQSLAETQLQRHQATFQQGIADVVRQANIVRSAYDLWLNEVKQEKGNAYRNLYFSLTRIRSVEFDPGNGTGSGAAVTQDDYDDLERTQKDALDALIKGDASDVRSLAKFTSVLREAALNRQSRTGANFARANTAVLITFESRGKPVRVKLLANNKALVHREDLSTVKTGLEARLSGLRNSRSEDFLTEQQKGMFKRKLQAADRLVAQIDLNNNQALYYPSFDLFQTLFQLEGAADMVVSLATDNLNKDVDFLTSEYQQIGAALRSAVRATIGGNASVASGQLEIAHSLWMVARTQLLKHDKLKGEVKKLDDAFGGLLQAELSLQFSAAAASEARRPLDQKKFLDMLIDDVEEKFIELVEGTRAQTSVIDDYIKRVATALDDDFNTQFYEPTFRHVREEMYGCSGVNYGQIEYTNVLTNNRAFAKVEPQATMEFDLPKRRIVIAEAMQAAQAAYNDYGALMNDPGFLALTKLNSGQPTASMHNNQGGGSAVRSVLPGLPSQSAESSVMQSDGGQQKFNSQLEALIPDPAIYKFETGTGYEIRPVIQPDGQSVVFDFNYMYTTNIREPVRADEKHLGRVKRQFVNTDVQIGNYELREVSRYRVALKASRTGQGVPLLQDIPIAGALFRPLPSQESSLQQNVILAKTVIFPTLYDLMGLRWAPAIADLDTEALKNQEFIYRNRMRWLKNEVYDYSSTQVDEFLRVPMGERRPDLYRTQQEIPIEHPDGRTPLGNNMQDSQLQEGYSSPGSGIEVAPQRFEIPGAEYSPPQSSIRFSPSDTQSHPHGTGATLRRVPVRATGTIQQGAYCPPTNDTAGRVRLENIGDRSVAPSNVVSFGSRLRALQHTPSVRSTSAARTTSRSPESGIRQASYESGDTAGRVILNGRNDESNRSAPAAPKSRSWSLRMPFQKHADKPNR